MFYEIWRVYPFFEKSAESKSFSANAEKHRKREAYTHFS
jgi:hypothetical protein